MKQEVMLSNSQGYPPEDGMLFVRTLGIVTTMVQVPILALGLLVVARYQKLTICFFLVTFSGITKEFWKFPRAKKTIIFHILEGETCVPLAVPL